MGKREKAPSEKSIYTLAQSRTGNLSNNSDLSGNIVYGKGTDMEDKTAWEGRAKRKLTTQVMVKYLVKAAEKKGAFDRAKGYWRAYHCQSRLRSADGRAYGHYCKTRFCTLCCSIRKAQLINKYLPIIETWKEPHFVTLTMKAFPAGSLNWSIRAMKRAFHLIQGRLMKRQERGKIQGFMGIRSLECNFNPVKKTYNPHWHILVPSEEIADLLIEEWLKQWKKTGRRYAVKAAQHASKVYNIDECLIEIIKYGTKIFTEPDMDKKSKIPRVVYASALDNIFAAFEGHRLFEHFGFNVPKEETDSTTQVTFLESSEPLLFIARHYGWVSEESGDIVIKYEPSQMLKFILTENINTDLE